MCMFIGMEALVANALIELLNKDGGTRRISLQTLVKYGATVVRFLQENDEDAILLMSRDYKDALLYNYSDFFALKTVEEEEFIELLEGKGASDLEGTFRDGVPFELLLALTDIHSLMALGVVD